MGRWTAWRGCSPPSCGRVTRWRWRIPAPPPSARSGAGVGAAVGRGGRRRRRHAARGVAGRAAGGGPSRGVQSARAESVRGLVLRRAARRSAGGAAHVTRGAGDRERPCLRGGGRSAELACGGRTCALGPCADRVQAARYGPALGGCGLRSRHSGETRRTAAADIRLDQSSAAEHRAGAAARSRDDGAGHAGRCGVRGAARGAQRLRRSPRTVWRRTAGAV